MVSVRIEENTESNREVEEYGLRECQPMYLFDRCLTYNKAKRFIALVGYCLTY